MLLVSPSNSLCISTENALRISGRGSNSGMWPPPNLAVGVGIDTVHRHSRHLSLRCNKDSRHRPRWGDSRLLHFSNPLYAWRALQRCTPTKQTRHQPTARKGPISPSFRQVRARRPPICDFDNPVNCASAVRPASGNCPISGALLSSSGMPTSDRFGCGSLLAAGSPHWRHSVQREDRFCLEVIVIRCSASCHRVQPERQGQR